MRRYIMKKMTTLILIAFIVNIIAIGILHAERNDDIQAIKKAVKENPRYKPGVEAKWFKVCPVKSICLTPLHHAASAGYVDVIRYFIDKGADFRQIDFTGQTSLHVAAWNGYKDVVAIFIQLGLGVNDKDEQGETPLHLAAFSGHSEVADLLLTHGADVSIENKAGQTPLQKATKVGHKEIVDLLASNVVREAGKKP